MLYRYVEQLLNVYNYIDAMLVTDERGSSASTSASAPT